MNSTAKSPDPIQIWADVGGTFTDCFLFQAGQRQRIKVLSTGVVRCRVGAASSSDRLNLVLPDAFRVDRFWNGCSLRLIDGDGASEPLGKIADYRPSDSHLTLDRPDRLPPDFVGQMIELDADLEAPVLAARLLLGVPLDEDLPRVEVRLGTTRGTNALLTRSGASTALLTTTGFGDVLRIGEQDRPDLFALSIKKPTPLTETVVEIDERLSASGEVLIALDEDKVVGQLRDLKESGIESLAICLMHAHVNDLHERRIEDLARALGFSRISRSGEVAPLIKLVSRAETTTLDAYLNPILDQYLQRIEQQFGGPERCRLQVMTSGGNLVSRSRYRGRDCVLSGPAGGVVSLGSLARADGCDAVIGLDMGGTSTDVSRFQGKVGKRFESRIDGLRILTPMMDIHTVAAGGGSICDVRHRRLCVGPDSAGSDPGPACYGRGGPFTITDANLVLGRLPSGRFPFPLNRDATDRRIEALRDQWQREHGESISVETLADGFVRIACTHMAEAVRSITVAQGSDPRGMTLVGFGGAAGLHLCQVAELLGVERIIDHPEASLLSALGMGLADQGSVATRGIYRSLASIDGEQLRETLGILRREALERLAGQATTPDKVQFDAQFDLRYDGTESSMTFHLADLEHSAERDDRILIELTESFHRRHESLYGYRREGRDIELATLRYEARIPSSHSIVPTETSGDIDHREPGTANVWMDDRWRRVEIHERSRLTSGHVADGPALIVGDHASLLVRKGWSWTVDRGGIIHLQRSESTTKESAGVVENDSVALEVVARRLQGIADAMGEVLRRTAVSVNVKERRDFSCAVFDRKGALIANAPHVPVHLGAMGHTVRHLIDVFPQMWPGDCYVSNDPFTGGSHLPDVTVVSPVFCQRDADSPDFYVASRAHHAEIGGLTPGSMPPQARCLAEEGVVIREFPLVRNGVETWQGLEVLLTSGEYPSRSPRENLADIEAQQAAGSSAAAALSTLVRDYSSERVERLMRELSRLAGDSLRNWICTLPDEERSFRDCLDDGTAIAVAIKPLDDPPRLIIDFSGTAPVHHHGYNATPSIVTSAVMYVLRTAVGGDLPLCDGLLRDVEIAIPPGLLNPPFDDDPSRCPAVVAGNVETSQRVVDVLLGALGVAAASQGTMNNLLIGDNSFGYYETIGGGSGATEQAAGADGVQVHMTNTRMTDPEVLESRLPCRLWTFSLRRGSGGGGRYPGGDGLVREIEFLSEVQVSLVTGRRTKSPYGMRGGRPGHPGRNWLIRNGHARILDHACTLAVHPGDRLRIETPGGGGWGEDDQRG